MTYFNNPKLSSRKSPSKRLHPLVLSCLFLACLFLLVAVLYLQETGRMSIQSKQNLAAAGKPTLWMAVAEYPSAWPPAYPASLYVFSHFGAPIRLFNLLCFCGVLFTVWLFAWSCYPRLSPAIPVLFVALVHANYSTLHQQTAEALFLLLAVMSLLLLGRSKRHPSSLLAGGLGLLAAAAVLTRFFALFWLVPIALLHLTALSTARSWRKRITHALAYIAPMILFVLPWLLYLHRRTGSFSGMNRFAPRQFGPNVAEWGNLTGFGTNVKFVLKTTFIDLFSSHRTATHGVVNADGITKSESIVLFAVLGLAVLVCAGFFHLLRKLPGSSRIDVAIPFFMSFRSLPAHFAATYLVAMIVLWTATNNDPIYTRFMFPSYVFIVLTASAAFTWFREHASSHLFLMPWYLLAFLFAGTNLLNIRSGLAISWSIFR